MGVLEQDIGILWSLRERAGKILVRIGKALKANEERSALVTELPVVAGPQGAAIRLKGLRRLVRSRELAAAIVVCETPERVNARVADSDRRPSAANSAMTSYDPPHRGSRLYMCRIRRRKLLG